MRLLAALIPPESVRDDLAAVLWSVPGGAGELDPVPAHALYLWLGNFGNVAVDDALALEEALAEAVSGQPPLRLRFRGGSALDRPGDDSIWASLQGDVEQLDTLGREIPRVVRPLGFFLDRRAFRPQVRVGRITEATTAAYLQRVVDRLQGYAGSAWTCQDVALIRARARNEDAEDEEFEVLRWFRLAGDRTR